MGGGGVWVFSGSAQYSDVCAQISNSLGEY